MIYEIIFRLITQVFIALLSCSKSLATKCMSLTNESCMNRSIIIDSNPNEVHFYPFMVS